MRSSVKAITHFIRGSISSISPEQQSKSRRNPTSPISLSADITPFASERGSEKADGNTEEIPRSLSDSQVTTLAKYKPDASDESCAANNSASRNGACDNLPGETLLIRHVSPVSSDFVDGGKESCEGSSSESESDQLESECHEDDAAKEERTESASSSRFLDLLNLLAEEHERQVVELQVEIERARSGEDDGLELSELREKGLIGAVADRPPKIDRQSVERLILGLTELSYRGASTEMDPTNAISKVLSGISGVSSTLDAGPSTVDPRRGCRPSGSGSRFINGRITEVDESTIADKGIFGPELNGTAEWVEANDADKSDDAMRSPPDPDVCTKAGESILNPVDARRSEESNPEWAQVAPAMSEDAPPSSVEKVFTLSVPEAEPQPLPVGAPTRENVLGDTIGKAEGQGRASSEEPPSVEPEIVLTNVLSTRSSVQSASGKHLRQKASREESKESVPLGDDDGAYEEVNTSTSIRDSIGEEPSKRSTGHLDIIKTASTEEPARSSLVASTTSGIPMVQGLSNLVGSTSYRGKSRPVLAGLDRRSGAQADNLDHRSSGVGGEKRSILKKASFPLTEEVQLQPGSQTQADPRKRSESRKVSWTYEAMQSEAIKQAEAKKEKSLRLTQRKVLDCWHVPEADAPKGEDTESRHNFPQIRGHSSFSSNRGSILNKDIAADKIEQAANESNCLLKRLSRFVTTPNSSFSFSWDFACMIMIGCDCVLVPLELSFEPEPHWILDVVTLMTMAYWTADLVKTFFTGYYSMGTVIVNMRMIARNYFRTWFPLDFCLVVLDWILNYAFLQAIFDASGGGLDLGEFRRVTKAMRLLRLFRSVKMGRIFKMIEDRIYSEAVSIIMQMAKLFLAIVIANHVIACCWYLIGKVTSNSGMVSWVNLDLAEPHDLVYAYFSSFHWALTQFTPASISIQPHNIWERIFGNIVLLFALVCVSSLLSGVTSLVMLLRSLGSAKSKQFWLLRRYLREAEVPREIALRVQRYCDFAWDSQETRLQEKNVPVLKLLPMQMKEDLNIAIYEPAIHTHPVFLLMSKLSDAFMRQFYNIAVCRVMLVKSDTLFNSSEESKMCYVVTRGEATYTVKGKHVEDLSRFAWICEPALWTKWTCLGTLVAKKDCDIIGIDSVAFGKLAQDKQITDNMSRLALEEAIQYARSYVNGLNKVDSSSVTDRYQSIILEGLWFRIQREYKKDQSTLRQSSRRFRSTMNGGALIAQYMPKRQSGRVSAMQNAESGQGMRGWTSVLSSRFSLKKKIIEEEEEEEEDGVAPDEKRDVF